MTNILKCDECGELSSDYTLLGQECTDCTGIMEETDKPYTEWEEACKTCRHYADAVESCWCARGEKTHGRYCYEEETA